MHNGRIICSFWPWPNDLHIWTSPIFPADINFLHQGFQQLSSNWQTDRHERNYVPCHFACGK